MKKCCTLVFAGLLGITALSPAYAEDELKLVEYMGGFQYFSHKTFFSIEHKNKALAEFYLHEVEEILEKVEGIEEFDGFKVGNMSKTLLEPALKELEENVEGEKWDAASKSFESMIKACNSCHESVKREYIHIVKPEVNPFMQSFDPVGK